MVGRLTILGARCGGRLTLLDARSVRWGRRGGAGGWDMGEEGAQDRAGDEVRRRAKGDAQGDERRGRVLRGGP